MTATTCSAHQPAALIASTNPHTAPNRSGTPAGSVMRTRATGDAIRLAAARARHGHETRSP